MNKKLILIVFLAAILGSICCNRGEKNPANSSNKNIVYIAQEVGSIKGQVRLKDVQDNSGIVVFIAGTSYFAYTDEKGDFTIYNVPFGEYEIRSQKEGYFPAKIGTVRLFKSNTIDTQNIILPPFILSVLPTPTQEPLSQQSGSITGLVLIPDAPSSSGVVVQIDNTNYKTVTDTEGRYTFPAIPPGKYNFTFSKGDFKHALTEIEVVKGKETVVPDTTLNFTEAPTPKEPEHIISGIVEMYDEHKNRADNYDSVLITLEGTNYIATPDATGNFVFRNLQRGNYVLSAKAPTYVLRNKIEIDLNNQDSATVVVALDRDIQKVEDAGVLKGKVQLESPQDNAAPVDNSGVIAGLAGTSYLAYTDKDGNFMIKDIPVGKYTLIAQAEGYVPYSYPDVEIIKDQETNISDIELLISVTPPEVIYTSPGDGEEGVIVKREVPVIIKFSQSMKPESVKQAFSISPAVDHKLIIGQGAMYSNGLPPYGAREKEFAELKKIQESTSDDVLLVKLFGISDKNPVQYDAKYTITIGNTAENYEEVTLQEPYVFSFATGKAAVVGTKPANGERKVVVGQHFPLMIYFNAAIDHTTLTPNNIKISPEPASSVEIQAQDSAYNDGWTEVALRTNLNPETKYTVTLSKDIATMDGKSLSNTPYKFSFTTYKAIEYKPQPLVNP